MIAIIPARSGSKRIKNKNIKKFNKQPIICWSIKAAINSKLFEEVIVSTDSKKIKTIAEKYGAKVPFIRPKNLSGDFTPTRDVIKHALDYLKKKYGEVNDFCCIYPTAPLLEKNTLVKSYKIFNKFNKEKYIFSAVKFSYPVQRGFYITNKNKIKPMFKKNFKKRSQDLKNIYHDAGQFYMGTINMIKKNINIFSDEAYPIILDESLVQDIDTMTDWKIAELKFKKKSKS